MERQLEAKKRVGVARKNSSSRVAEVFDAVGPLDPASKKPAERADQGRQHRDPGTQNARGTFAYL